MIATIIQGKELWQTVVASVVAGVGITFAFSVAIWGASQFIELSRKERPVAAAAAAIVASTALTAVAAAVVVGIIVMTSK
jgi:cation transporter-like permease